MKIAIIGTESVGKTTLARQIEKETSYNVLYEYGREYTENKVVEDMTVQDYLNINEEHIRRFNEINGDVILDSETITTISWCKLMLNIDLDIPIQDICDKYIFLLNEDVDFVQDGTRVTESIRTKHQEILIQLLEKNNLLDKTTFVNASEFSSLDSRNDYIIKNYIFR